MILHYYRIIFNSISYYHLSFEKHTPGTLSKMKLLHNQSGGLFVWRHDPTAREQ